MVGTLVLWYNPYKVSYWIGLHHFCTVFGPYHRAHVYCYLSFEIYIGLFISGVLASSNQEQKNDGSKLWLRVFLVETLRSIKGSMFSVCSIASDTGTLYPVRIFCVKKCQEGPIQSFLDAQTVAAIVSSMHQITMGQFQITPDLGPMTAGMAVHVTWNQSAMWMAAPTGEHLSWWKQAVDIVKSGTNWSCAEGVLFMKLIQFTSRFVSQPCLIYETPVVEQEI